MTTDAQADTDAVADTDAPPVLAIKNVTYVYPDGTRALEGVSLTVREGERVAILGANGAGKSTLLLHLNGTLTPTAGTVTVAGLPTATRKSRRCVRERVGMVFQDPGDQLFCPTVREDVAFGPRHQGLAGEALEERVAGVLQQVGMPGVETKSPFHLSLGQKKRVALATVLAMRPWVLALDEPTANLDPRGRREIADLLANLPGTMVLITHDLAVARRLAQRAVVLGNGRVVADGSPDAVLAEDSFLTTHGLA